MRSHLILLVSILIIQKSVAPPVTPKKKEDTETDNDESELEYHRYLKEVIEILETDPDFRAKLEKFDEADIINGKIADHLEFVNHQVRTKLDELKRNEIERLRHLMIKEYELNNGLDTEHLKIAEHLDHTNPHTFEIDDLKKLIAKTTKDLEEADKERREDFKEYEMKKKFEQEEKIKKMNEEDKKKYENELNELEKKHKEHKPLHHPGSKKQLEEVWEKQDHMEDQQFDPRTFFFLHDLDGNGIWDQNELKTLFIKELDKIYTGEYPDDVVEKAEEMERMREHVMKEVDRNKDGMISYEEFLDESNKPEFEQDPGWETLDEQQIYSEQEYAAFKAQKAQEIERAVAKGMLPENPAVHPQAEQHQFPPSNQVYQDHMQQQAQYQHQVPPQQQYPPNPQAHQVPPQYGQFNQMPPQQDQFAHQVPLQQQQQQQQYHPNQQVPVYNNLNNIPQQQVPVGHNQVPPQQPPVAQNINQIPQQQQQQQFNPSINQQQNQQPVATNNVNQAPQQVYQNQPSVDAAHPSNQQVPVATGQNQVPQQIASINNAQAHHGAPNVVKT